MSVLRCHRQNDSGLRVYSNGCTPHGTWRYRGNVKSRPSLYVLLGFLSFHNDFAYRWYCNAIYHLVYFVYVYVYIFTYVYVCVCMCMCACIRLHLLVSSFIICLFKNTIKRAYPNAPSLPGLSFLNAVQGLGLCLLYVLDSRWDVVCFLDDAHARTYAPTHIHPPTHVVLIG